MIMKYKLNTTTQKPGPSRAGESARPAVGAACPLCVSASDRHPLGREALTPGWRTLRRDDGMSHRRLWLSVLITPVTFRLVGGPV